MEIKITQDILDFAEKANSSHCMIAEAIRVKNPQLGYISVDLATIRYTNRKTRLRYTYLTPRSVQNRIVQFDQGICQEPFSFNLHTHKPAFVTKMGRGSGAEHKRKAMRAAKKKQQSSAKSPKSSAKSPTTKPAIKGHHNKGYTGVSPIVVGGVTPPRSASPGLTRAFGLKDLSL